MGVWDKSEKTPQKDSEFTLGSNFLKNNKWKVRLNETPDFLNTS